jgi:hypothetical protein
MIRAPLKTRITDRPIEPSTTTTTMPLPQPQPQRSPAVNAYLQHLQSKSTSHGSNNLSIDERQTIASPSERGRLSFRQPQPPLQPPPLVTSSTSGTTSHDGTKRIQATAAKTLPRSSPTNANRTPQSGKKGRGCSRNSKGAGHKPPLGTHQKHPRSTLSEATNSTYLSSDSDDASTATATVQSDGTSSFRSGQSTSGGARRRIPKHPNDIASGSSPRATHNYPEQRHTFSPNHNALVPYHQDGSDDPYCCYTHDDVFDDDAYGTDNNSGNYYFTDPKRYSTQYDSDMNVVRRSERPLRNHENPDEFSYSDEDDHYHHHQNRRNQQNQEQDYTDEDTDTLAVDLDQLIEEASARWKLSVNETVQGTVTTTSFVSQQGGFSAATPFVSPILQRQYGDVGIGLVVPAPPFSSSDHLPTQYVPTLDGNQTGTFPDRRVSASSSSSQLIQEQQNEIEALRAALQRHQHPVTSGTDVVQDNRHHYSPQPQQSVHPIQVLTVATDQHTTVEDDLTVWSGFHSMSAAPPPIQRRPDSDVSSIVAETSHPRPVQQHATSNVSRAPRVPPCQPTRPSLVPPQTVQLELSSVVTGVTRSAIFTGTIASNASPTSDAFTTLCNVSITGTGVLQFLETGDVYRGDVVHSEMHGYGTYTFVGGTSNTQQPLVLHGRFEHNVFID